MIINLSSKIINVCQSSKTFLANVYFDINDWKWVTDKDQPTEMVTRKEDSTKIYNHYPLNYYLNSRTNSSVKYK